MACSFKIQPRRGGHFWCGSGDVSWRRMGGKVGLYSSIGSKMLEARAMRHLSAALQITFDRAQAVGSLRLFRPHHFQQLSKQRQGIGLTIQLSCPLKPFLHPGSWRIGSYSSHPSRLHPKLFVSAFVGYIRLIIPRNKQSYTPPSRS